MSSHVLAYRHRGLRVHYQHLPGPLTAIALVVRAGARLDGRHPGIAHMAEHMLFQGTTWINWRSIGARRNWVANTTLTPATKTSR